MYRLIEPLLVSLTGGFIFRLLHIPLPWMLGPLAAAMIWHSIMKRPVYWPVGLRNLGLVILGYTMGLSFTIETGKQILQQLPTMMLSTVSVVFFSLLTAPMYP